MLSSAWFRFGLLLAAVGLFMAATTPALGRDPRAYGQRLVAQYQLPPDTIARYTALAAGTAVNASPRENSMFADRSPWVGPDQRAGVGHNPYTLVFTVSGVAKAAGEVHAQWQAGWQVHESPIASRELLMAVPRIVRTGMAAGQALTLTASSARVSFRGERSVAPMLGLVQMRNLDINDVQLQVWSGATPQVWAVPPWSRAALLALVTYLLVGLGFKYWQRTVHEPAGPPQGRIPECAARRYPDEPAGPPQGRIPEGAARRYSDEPGAQPARSREQPRKRSAGPNAVGGDEAVAALDRPVPAAPSHEARVIATLHEVLTVGLTVHTVLDEVRMRKRTAP